MGKIKVTTEKLNEMQEILMTYHSDMEEAYMQMISQAVRMDTVLICSASENIKSGISGLDIKVTNAMKTLKSRIVGLGDIAMEYEKAEKENVDVLHAIN